MSFNVAGIIEGERYEIVWDAGGLYGDEIALRLVEKRAAALEGQDVGPVGGPYTFENHLEDPLSALLVMDEVFDTILELSGDVPEAPEVPEGAAA